jgi:hypothetical protein
VLLDAIALEFFVREPLHKGGRYAQIACNVRTACSGHSITGRRLNSSFASVMSSGSEPRLTKIGESD